ncbi:bifunctional 4-hydroxy-2-oxoglutarate aldolase/2-dehydro-3-deoxy-phosphogluconate aldolase [Streptococcus sp. H49]|uniref:bifunctional 4-hydroxy-2-oxoglutarate aldolase/2-dehydro-3-deoxy-phosphogluconate aldolase n=1 Tax=Streptococcus huangxiaojuni TaxID=3237239 RepID=UPI0034A0EAE7
MRLEDYRRFTVIIRGYNLQQADKIINVLREYAQYFTVEIALNTKDSLPMLRFLSAKYGQKIFIGAGTVKTLEDAKAAVGAGAQFLLSPHGFTQSMLDYSKAEGILAIPGAMTPSEINEQFTMGADIVKIFPAETVGSQFFEAVQSPLGSLPLMAVGGINAVNFKDFFNKGAMYIGMGGGIFRNLNIDTVSEATIRELLEVYLK